jgi:hypothetical protein
MYNKALGVGILPSEFWEMSLREVRNTVDSRIRQKNNEIYSLSGMIRVAVLSAFSKEVQFPASPDSSEKGSGNWENSKNYMKALQKVRGGAK